MAHPTTAYSLALLSEYTHSLDSLPLDLSRNFADLRELDAVLSSSMTLITAKITKLTALIQDRSSSPEERLWLLSEIGEEAHRLKLGGEDKIKVASAAADNLKNHKHHLVDLLHYLPNFDPSVLNRNTVYPHVTNKSYPPLSALETGRRQRRGGNLTSTAAVYTNGLEASPHKRRRGARDDDIDVGTGKTPRREKVNDVSRARNGARGGRRWVVFRTIYTAFTERPERAASPAESLLSVTSHVPQTSNSRQNASQSASRNGQYASTTTAAAAAANASSSTAKRSRLASVTSNATEQQYENRGSEIYSNQPPTSSSLHPSLPLPYASTHGAEWALTNNQLEGPGMPVARGNSHPMGIPINVPVVVAPVVDPQVDAVGAAGDADGDGDDNKTYCFCNSVSYGEMIACDDTTCEREWVRSFVFLFPFVGYLCFFCGSSISLVLG